MKKARRFQNKLLTGLLYMLGFASPLMLVACYAPPSSQVPYQDMEEVADSLDEVLVDDENLSEEEETVVAPSDEVAEE